VDSILASHPAAPSLTPSSPIFFLLELFSEHLLRFDDSPALLRAWTEPKMA